MPSNWSLSVCLCVCLCVSFCLSVGLCLSVCLPLFMCDYACACIERCKMHENVRNTRATVHEAKTMDYRENHQIKDIEGWQNTVTQKQKCDKVEQSEQITYWPTANRILVQKHQTIAVSTYMYRSKSLSNVNLYEIRNRIKRVLLWEGPQSSGRHLQCVSASDPSSRPVSENY